MVVVAVPAAFGVVVMFCPLMAKTTVPPEPAGSCAVKVMGVRAGAGLRLEVREMAGVLLPVVTESVAELGSKFVSPGYSASRASEPAVSVEVFSVAVPAERALLPRDAVLLEKATLPVAS